MNKLICFIHTESELKSHSLPITKKNLYCSGKILKLNYEIGYFEDNIFIQEIKYLHSESKNKEIDYSTISKFQNDISNVNIIIGHNINYHIKTILVELIRYNIQINFNNYIIIDINNFYHNFTNISIYELADKLLKKIPKKADEIELSKILFYVLYNKIKY
jgi:hypothetical protein